MPDNSFRPMPAGAACLVHPGIGLLRTRQSGLPSAQYPTLTALVPGLAFAALTFLVKAPVGTLAGRLSTWLRSRPGVLPWVFRSSGAILVALGARLAFEWR